MLKSHVGTLISIANSIAIASTTTPYRYALFSTIIKLSCVWPIVFIYSLRVMICGVDTILIAIPNFFIMTVTSLPSTITIIFKPHTT